jgi:hypothetical protein
MSSQTGTYCEATFTNIADYTALASSNVEATLLTPVSPDVTRQPTFFPSFWAGNQGIGRMFTIRGGGVFSTTATPTMIFQFRLSPTVGVTTLSGASVGITAGIVTASGITNKWFWFELDMVCRISGQGASKTTLSGTGFIQSPGGFATPFLYPIEPTTPDTATWTQTVDSSVANYLNVSLTWSASSSSNTCQLKHLAVIGWN